MSVVVFFSRSLSSEVHVIRCVPHLHTLRAHRHRKRPRGVAEGLAVDLDLGLDIDALGVFCEDLMPALRAFGRSVMVRASPPPSFLCVSRLGRREGGTCTLSVLLTLRRSGSGQERAIKGLSIVTCRSTRDIASRLDFRRTVHSTSSLP